MQVAPSGVQELTFRGDIQDVPLLSFPASMGFLYVSSAWILDVNFFSISGRVVDSKMRAAEKPRMDMALGTSMGARSTWTSIQRGTCAYEVSDDCLKILLTINRHASEMEWMPLPP